MKPDRIGMGDLTNIGPWQVTKSAATARRVLRFPDPLPAQHFLQDLMIMLIALGVCVDTELTGAVLTLQTPANGENLTENHLRLARGIEHLAEQRERFILAGE